MFRLITLLLLLPSIAWAVPNIIIIHIGDDVHPSALGVYRATTHPETATAAGNGLWTLTALDTMAAQGVRFTNFYSQHVCSPSRAELFGFGWAGSPSNPYGRIQTGSQSPSWTIQVAAGNETIISVFQQAGYEVAGFGKLHLGFEQILNFGKDTFPKQLGFDYYEAFLPGNDERGHSCSALLDNEAGDCWGHNSWCKLSLDGSFEISGDGTSTVSASNGYVNKVIEEEVAAYLNTLTLATDKRLIIIGWVAPHGPWHDGDTDGSGLVCDYDDDGTIDDYKDDRPPGNTSDNDGADDELPVYGAQIEDLSVRIGVINGMLDLASGNADHLAVFVGDNGVPSTQAPIDCTAAVGQKGSPYPCGTNVPLIFQGDAVGGTDFQITKLFRMIDLPATLARMIGTTTTRPGTYSFHSCVENGDNNCLSRPYTVTHRFGPTMGGNVGSDGTAVGTNYFPPHNGDVAEEWDFSEYGAHTQECGGKQFFLDRYYDTLITMADDELCENFYEVTVSDPYLEVGNVIIQTSCDTPNYAGRIATGGLSADQLCAYTILNDAINQRHRVIKPIPTYQGVTF